MTVEIIPQDIPDFFYMVRWFTKNKGNTFAVLYQQREDRVPDHIDAMFQERYGYHFNRD